MEVKKLKAFLRMVVILVLVLSACLVGFDTQRKLVFEVLEKKATFKDLDALFVLILVLSVAAGYNLLQLFLEVSASNRINESYKCAFYLNWVYLLFDQVMVYVVFATTAAALQSSMLAVTGETSLNWMKVCDSFTRFCYQIGGGLLCCFIAWFVMTIVSSISAFNVFCLYSPQHFMLRKP